MTISNSADEQPPPYPHYCSCREEPLRLPARVAFLGEEGSFSCEAAHGFANGLGRPIVPVSTDTVAQVFRLVERRKVEYGVVPIENLLHGPVRDTLEAFRTGASEIRVCGESVRSIHLCLAAQCSPEAIRTVYSRAEAFSQCERSLRPYAASGGTTWQLAPVPSTAHAAKRAAADPAGAAIVSEETATLHGLEIIASGVQDSPWNRTRFVLVSRHPSPPPSGADRTSLLVELEPAPGGFFAMFAAFAHPAPPIDILAFHVIPLPKCPTRWEYLFFLDIAGHITEPRIAAAVAALRQASVCRAASWLGSFPRCA